MARAHQLPGFPNQPRFQVRLNHLNRTIANRKKESFCAANHSCRMAGAAHPTPC
jgi:hypothetical protein